MAKNVVINGVTYNDVKELKVPLASDSSQMAVYPDTSDATATAADIKDGETAYIDGEKVEGTMPVNGDVSGQISRKDGSITIPAGHTSGGTVTIDPAEKAKLISRNIRQGVTVLGVAGSMSATEGANPQEKTVTPTKSKQVVTPDEGYNYMSQVTVEAIPAQYITTTDATAVATDIKNGKTAYVNGKKVTGSHTDPAFTLANGVLSIV